MIDFAIVVINPQAEANTAARAHRVYAHRGQHVRRFERTGRARGAARSADAELIELHENGFRLDTIERNVAGVRQARFLAAVSNCVRGFGEDRFLHAVSHGAHASVLVVQMFQREFGGFAKRDNSRHVFGAAPPPALLVPAYQIRLKLALATDIKKPDAFRRVKFVRRKRKVIDAQRLRKRLVGFRCVDADGKVRDVEAPDFLATLTE